MKFENIFIEEQIIDHPRTQMILSHPSLRDLPRQEIRKVEDIFNRVKKPYLQKRTSLNIFIGKKEGALVKGAPNAYGQAGAPHYYFIHAYNCLYECQYCYLQGYFNSPDLVLFINHEDIGEEIKRLSSQVPTDSPEIWFHAGEFSDSLALSHITQEWPYYWQLFSSLPDARLELRTKSSNIKSLLPLPPTANIITSFSLAPHSQCKNYDLGAPPLSSRLKAMQTLDKLGHPLAVHLDPIIYSPQWETEFPQLLDQIVAAILPTRLRYLSMGVVRFTKDVYRQVEQNYPQSPLLGEEFVVSFDQKVRYPRPMRSYLLGKVNNWCLERGFKEEQLYFCMEES